MRARQVTEGEVVRLRKPSEAATVVYVTSPDAKIRLELAVPGATIDLWTPQVGTWITIWLTTWLIDGGSPVETQDVEVEPLVVQEIEDEPEVVLNLPRGRLTSSGG